MPLHPENRREARAAGDRRDAVQAARRVKHHVSRRQLHGVRAVAVLHDEFAAVIIIGLDQKQRGGQVGAHSIGRAGHLPDGVVHMRSEVLTGFVAIEQRRKYLQGQRRR